MVVFDLLYFKYIPKYGTVHALALSRPHISGSLLSSFFLISKIAIGELWPDKMAIYVWEPDSGS